MRTKPRLWLCAAYLLLPLTPIQAQVKSVGLPFVYNYSTETYSSGSQNWDIAQDSRGFMYFGNNQGLLRFDGSTWRTHPVPNGSIVRSVMVHSDGRIYIGAFETIGYFHEAEDGSLGFHSLVNLIPEAYRKFDEVWRIHRVGESVVFQSFNYIFIYDGEAVRVVEPYSKFELSFLAGDELYVIDKEAGLCRLRGVTLQRYRNHPLFSNNEIRFLIPIKPQFMLVGTTNEGVYTFDGEEFHPWDGAVNKHLVEGNVFSGLMLESGYLAFGTISNGLFITDPNGKIVQHVNRQRGLQNNTVLSIFEDKVGNVWLGLDRGIDHIETSSQLTIINYNYGVESSYSSIVFNDILYIATNQGLVAIELHKLSSPSPDEKNYHLIAGTEGQVWNLTEIDGSLLCGHNFGCFQVEGLSARRISSERGFWGFFQPKSHPNIAIAGTYQGLHKLERVGERWVSRGKIDGFDESSRIPFEDEMGNVWFAHGYRGVFRLQLSQYLDSAVSINLYDTSHGLSGELPYFVHKFNGKLLATTHTGVFEYSHATDSFSPSEFCNTLFAGKPLIELLRKDANGNIWYCSNTYMGVQRLLEDWSYRDISTPFNRINDYLINSFQDIYIHSPSSVFIGTEIGLVHYNPSRTKDYQSYHRVYVRDALFFGNEKFSPYKGRISMASKQPEAIPYSNNSIRISFSSPSYEDPSKTTYSFRLKGFNDTWTLYEAINFKEYTNLREGTYTFEVKAKNIYLTESPAAQYQFTILPPWYRTTVAYILYLIILLAGGVMFYIYLIGRIKRIRATDKKAHRKQLAETEQRFQEEALTAEKEMAQLRNEKLKSEMIHKNKELANTTLHLIQNTKMVNILRTKLEQLSKKSNDYSIRQEIDTLIKQLNRHQHSNANWEVFNEYFDEVHQDFTRALKEKFPTLTPKDLRLCAFLRMNISTKEIAPLMNISIRGVEISRYRLRKKLNLDKDANLTEFLLSI